MDLAVRVATAAEVSQIVSQLGREPYFAECLAKQADKRGCLIVAFLSGLPVGSVYVSFDDPDEPELRQRMPGVALLQRLEVLPSVRRRGIGAALLAGAEEFLRDLGRAQVILGVTVGNALAAAWYPRLGYAVWPYPPIETVAELECADGTVVRTPEWCQIYVKSLAG